MGVRTVPTGEEARRTAAEAWIWGYPLLVHYRTLYAQAVAPDGAGGLGRFRHSAEPPDTPRSRAWLDLRAEPWVVSVPATDRYYVLAVHDLDTVLVGSVGSRATGPEAGDYLIAGPGWTGAVPGGIDGVLHAATHLVGVVGRTHLAGPEDLPALREARERYRLRPLSDFTDTAAPHPAEEPLWPVWREEETDTVAFLAVLDFLLRFVPVLDSDRDLRDRLAALGVDGGGAFEPAALAPGLRAALEAGVADGRARLAEAAATSRPRRLHGTRAEPGADPSRRALDAHEGWYELPGAEVWHGGWERDPDGGGPPDGARYAYAIRFAPGLLPPARFLWAATLRPPSGRPRADGGPGRRAIGDRTPGVLYDDDGGLTLYVAHRRPADPKRAANWLPAPAGPFALDLRLYGPDPSVLDGRWTPPPLVVDDGGGD
ncbi:DUF1254 domain-containing protein [Streptomyces sp. NPDC056503]|uniref:DUF1254 domain-containing protein n=1 Tax=Streptomyces sp. NPDC056503 TaxID=3345842 RepID=UPI0036795403